MHCDSKIECINFVGNLKILSQNGIIILKARWFCEKVKKGAYNFDKLYSCIRARYKSNCIDNCI